MNVNVPVNVPDTDSVKRIFIVDDHPIVADGLKQLISGEDGLECCGIAYDSAGALDEIGRLRPDLSLVDLSLPGRDGMDLIKELRSRHPEVLILVVSMLDETLYAERALRAGARGYVMKQEASARLLDAVRRVLQGEIAVSSKMASALLAHLADERAGRPADPADSLSDRELNVLRLIGEGRRVKEIAAQLNLSPKTVESYRERIKDKLNIGSAAELVRYAAVWVEKTRG